MFTTGTPFGTNAIVVGAALAIIVVIVVAITAGIYLILSDKGHEADASGLSHDVSTRE